MIGLLTQAEHFLRQLQTALAALGPHLTQGHMDAVLRALGANQFQLRVCIVGKAVDGHHGRQAEHLGDILHMLEQIGQSALQRLQVLLAQFILRHAAVVLQRLYRGHNDHGGGRQARIAALDVQKLLRAQVRAEARLRHHIIAQLQGGIRGRDRIAAVGNIGEWAAVDQGRRMLQRLNQVWLDGILEQGGHRPLSLQVGSGHGLVVIGVAHYDTGQPLLQILQVGGQAEHSHNLGGHCDVEAILPGHALHPAAQAVHNIAQLPVVHVHAALPSDFLHVDAQGVALLNMVVQHGRQQVVGCADGVEIAGKVEVDFLHGHHLGVTTAGSAALHAEHGAQRGLPQS